MANEVALDEVAPDPNQARARLIDHFKRAYQIIVGLAITLACTKLSSSGGALSFWLFCTFFVTVVPIFHGGDRSLDVKYLLTPARGFAAQASYVWDVYMLLITAILFVKVAQVIPGTGIAFGSGAPSGPESFYRWMAGLLAFDIGILFVDYIKTKCLGRGVDSLVAYLRWGIMNALLALICYVASFQGRRWGAPEIVGSAIFAVALLRTKLDYYFGRDFLFP